MENNRAVVCTLKNIKKIEGADKIVSADVTLNDVPISQVIVGVNEKENTKVVFFDSNLCIHPDVIQYLDKNNPDFGKEGFKSIGTYLGKNGRVRTIKLKGCYSSGLIVPVEKISGLSNDPSVFVEGFNFTDLEGKPICYKYTVPVRTPSQGTGKEGKKEKPGTRIVKGMFPEHVDTDNLSKNVFKINPYSVGEISSKYHGTSVRIANTLIYRKLSLVERIAKFFGAKVQETEYKYAFGSRTVTKQIYGVEDNKKHNHFYSGGDLWSEAGKKYFLNKLHEGETVYAEIVGYTLDGKPIQKIGKYIYNYGCQPNTFEVYVYRITRTSPSGVVTELSIPQYRDRCAELNVKAVPQLWYGRLADKYPDLPVDENWGKEFVKRLANEYLEKDEPTCMVPGTPDEGIVLRIEAPGIEVYKHKSMRFLHGESASYDSGDTVDAEDSEVIENQEDSENNE